MTKKNNFKILIGLFVIVGSIIGIGTIIWLGASKYFDGGKLYVAYFDGSVQGLNPDSKVKLRGVNIGRVRNISVDPSSALVEVVMSLDTQNKLGQNVCAELKSVGLTGIMFIDLDLTRQGERLLYPPADPHRTYPVIPSRASKTKQIFSSIDSVIQKLNSIQTDTIMKNMESATGRMDKTFQHAEELFADKRVDQILNETRETLVDTRALLHNVKNEIHDLKLKETSGQAQKMIEDLGKNSHKISSDLKSAGENLRSASEDIEVLVEQIKANPSEILFGRRPHARQGR
jgi:phospholipid/cholesterol/gamma-HCH transport system substrate-binding protein